MNKFVFSAIFLFSIISQSLGQNQEKGRGDVQNPKEKKMTTYYLIRHAEKVNVPGERDPELSEAGIARAAAWATYFNDIQLDEVYSTDFKRTRTTANATAESKNLQVFLKDPRAFHHPDFLASTTGKNVLVVGHSNTIPALANFILGEQKYQELDESEYSWLYILIMDENGKVISERKRIG